MKLKSACGHNFRYHFLHQSFAEMTLEGSKSAPKRSWHRSSFVRIADSAHPTFSKLNSAAGN